MYLREETLLLLCSQEEADHAEELQVGGGHLDLTQGAVEKVYGQIEGLCLEMDNLLVGNKQGIQDSKTSRKNIRIKFNILGKEVIRSCRKLGCSYTQPAWSGLWTFKFHPNQNYRSETSPGLDQKAKPWSETNKTVVRFSWDFHVRLSEISSNDVIKVNWKTSQDIFGQDRRALLMLVHFSPFIPVIMEGYPPI